jgi:cellulose synthase operon protein B
MDTKRFRLLVSLLAGFMLISLLLHLLSSQPSSAQVGKVSVEVPFPDAGYCFLRGLITPTTSLVRSREGECFTTIYKNSLAAMAFIHQGDITQAEGIFSFFQNQITATTPISGFHKDWDACEGSAPADNPPTYTNPYWVGDNAFLLLALNYYSQTRKIGSYGAYDSLATVLSNAVTLQANSRVITEAEGIADIYAALQPFLDDWDKWKIRSWFYDEVNYSSVADHMVRGALVFGDTTGFDYLNNFTRTEQWSLTPTLISAYAAASGQQFINVEVSAQILLATRLWQHDNPSSLRSELEKLRITSTQNPLCAGLPYYVTHHDFPGDYSKPILDSTAWLLYDDWRFNPFTSSTLKAITPYCSMDKFVRLSLEAQQQGFPRFYVVGQALKTFPQEINDGIHNDIVIQFATSRDLSRVPLTFTVATVDRGGAFSMKTILDNGDHCLNACDRSGVYANSGVSGTLLLNGCKQVFLPVITNVATGTIAQSSLLGSTTTYTYQLVLEGASGWGVFDWLQLEAPDGILWTIGNKDGKCSEFDNNGFDYSCNNQVLSK